MRRLKTVRRPPIYPETPGHLPCSSLTHPLPLSSRRPSVSFGGFGLTNRRAHYIRQVVQAMELEKQGAEMDWESVSPNGGIPFKKVPPGWGPQVARDLQDRQHSKPSGEES